MRFSFSVNGFGTSGISTGQFEFDLWDEFGQYGEAILAGASARLYEANGAFLPSREYYISARSVNNKVCRITAYDVMSKTNQKFEMPSFAENKTIDCDTVMGAVRGQCGFSSVGYSDRAGIESINFTAEQLKDKTCRGVMETVAEAMCGVWVADSEGGAVLSCFGAPYDYISAVSDYSEINMQGVQKITKLVVTDTESGDITEFSTGKYGTVFAIETPFPGTAPAVWERVRDKLYTAWSCEKAALTDIYPDVPAFTKITFGERELTATNISIFVDSTGVYFSGGADPQDEEQWRYEEYLQRELNKRVQIGKTVGNTQITPAGPCFIDKNLGTARNSENAAVEKYGFTVNQGGITEYDGAMLDGVFPVVETNGDLSEISINYENSTKKYAIKWDSDTRLSMEEIKEAEK